MISNDVRVLIIGGGTAGRTLAEEVKDAGAIVVGFMDDYSAESDVLGNLNEIREVISSSMIQAVYFAIPSAPAELIWKVLSQIDLKQTEFAILPRTYGILSKEKASINDLTDIDVLDLVGRAPVKHDLVEARSYIQGKKVAVTGAAGSIGSRLVKLLLDLGAEQILCIDRYENGIFFLERELHTQSSRLDFVVADVQNKNRINSLLQKFKPEILFHAAAYKHVPLMQQNKVEAINNNVWGTINMMRLAILNDVETFVYVSTDKAVNPTNVMGATKRLGELALRALALRNPKTKLVGVRFGNVIQSDGSVLQIFKKQIAAGEPLTVTHPEVTRFFMTLDEASQLIVQSAIAGNCGEIYVLDMGEPIKIMDLAEGLINTVAPNLSIEITGLRPGEKMFEELSYSEDEIDTTRHPKIFVVNENEDSLESDFLEKLDNLLVRTLDNQLESNSITQELKSFGFNNLNE